ncbi:ATP-grasp domain protein [Methyloligella halotolerans]|uniref:ATP-grasp domain protein n=1 Tax=Methyloligella halotolerans TaxID=1177755 RepID=A0A1E2S315_9HYPH|nr:ATP-grasp domain-containing protein [Methyloligella halotolerans]ODA68790.1 ATP-grasp domain protein [Methyloligella halotolerans]
MIPLTVDFFADRDTCEMAEASLTFDGAMKAGIAQDDLLDKLERLSSDAPSPPIGLLYGSGFEANPGMLDAVAARWPVLGNSSDIIAGVKDPVRFFETLRRLEIPHPETRATPPPMLEGWLGKRIGGSGGSHVGPAPATHSDGTYYQRQVEGVPVSLLFVANGREITPLGFSAQWPSPSPRSPWRYGGAVRPAGLGAALEERMASWVAALARAFGLIGLGSADFLVQGDEAWLLEINPRPGATLEIFDDPGNPLISFHLDAVTERKLPSLRGMRDAAASAVVFAEHGVTIPHSFDWPEWASDIPKPGEHIARNGPICTVMAREKTTDRARQLAETRVRDILAAVSGS